MGEVKLISEFYVRRQAEVKKSDEKYYLVPSELNLLLLNYSKFGYLYKKPQDFNSLLFFEKLKLSLSIALDHFYPLGGQLATESYENDHSSRIYVDFSKGQGAKVIYAIAPNLRLDDIMSPNNDIPIVVRSFFSVDDESINYDGHTKPLTLIQVTELKDGVYIGISVNHCLVDGFSYIHFVNTWSEIFMSSSSSSSISHEPMIRPSYLNNIQTDNKLPYINQSEFVIKMVPNIYIRERIFHFTNTTIAMLKSKANSQASHYQHKISSLQAISAFIWRSISRARVTANISDLLSNKQITNLHSNDLTSCVVVANLRPRFNPPLSQYCFGCLFTSATVTANISDLLSNNLGWAASLLHTEVNSIDDKEGRQAYSETPELVLPCNASSGPNPVFIVGSPILDFYGCEFGLGTPLSVINGGDNEDGKIAIFPSSKNDKSMDVKVALASSAMNALLLDPEFISLTSNIKSAL
ncbi:unnamed protein product [Amaranthus hypochondriacus]